MKKRVLLIGAWLLVGAEILIVAIEVLGYLRSGDTDWDAFFGDSVPSVAAILFAVVGAVIVTKQPRNPIGLLMIAPGLLAFGALATIPPPPSPRPLEYVGLYFSGVSWVLIVFPVALLIALFPTGKPASAPWRWHTWLATAMPGFFLVYVAFATVWSDTEVEPPWSIANPIGFITANPFENAVFTAIWTAGLTIVVGGALVALVVRYRRAHFVERQQIKWLLYAVTVFAAGFISQALFSGSIANENLNRLFGLVFVIGLMVIPISIAIALFKYKVFDIDLVIRRTLTYTAVTILLATVYVGSVVAFQAILESAVGLDSAIGIAASTVIVAALFNPLRRRIQSWVEKRFNRSRYDAEQLLADFGDRLRDGVDVNQIRSDLIDVVSQTMHPSTIGVWMFEPATTGRDYPKNTTEA